MRFTLLVFVFTVGLAAQVPPDTVNTIFPPGQRLESENFTGPVWVERILIVEDEEQSVPVGNVTFPPKSRSNWHYHPAGQSLLVLDGVGYYQQRGEAVRVLRKGQTVQCPPDVEHWHGAANDSWFVQLAMTMEHPDGRVIWGEAVTDAEYHAGIPVQRQVDSLASRYRHIARVAALTALGHLERLQPALADALDAGLTVNELKEVLVHLYAYAGFPRSIQGLRVLMTVLEGRSAKGSTDELDGDAGAVTSPPALSKGEGARYDRGLKTLEALTGRPWTEPSDYGTFAPRIDTFLKEHLFADVFGDTTLSYADREVVTVAVLQALGQGVEPMLEGHSSIALRQGVTVEQLSLINRTVQSCLH
ncbi:cupin domain-containing carboxymuconolactone decarboxylase family protein [Neolewinella sp.]|uniref:cupin domain-containing carboxymuconolactone decarboxylase family protein n=1 Tax=Neolewinella sp. TaxID=2993543 RepID=UPI003B516147